MCGCGCAQTAERSSEPAATKNGATVVRVDDMSCGHCVATITKAVQAKWPSAEVQADLAGRTISALGLAPDADLAAAIREAGYTPVA